MKMLWAVFFIGFLVACENPSLNPPTVNSDWRGAVYGEDSRQDLTASSANKLSQATALIMKNSEVSRASWRLGDSYVLCPDEPFQEQILRGFCSGVLVGPNKVLTAGHCLRRQSDCAEISLTFDWTLEKSTRDLKAGDLYQCKSIISQSYDLSQGWDYALIELDRPVKGVSPARLASSPQDLRTGDPVLSYSYPLGLPLKQDIGQVLSSNKGPHFLRVAVDTFSGSSGSPLYNRHGELVGILSSGASDFVEEELENARRNRTCANFRRCEINSPDPECGGELFFRVDLLKDLGWL